MSKNNLFNKYPAVIHGEARGENDEFVVYTRYPRFLARVSFDDDFTGELPPTAINGEIGRTEGSGKLSFKSGIGVWLSDFIFLDPRPDDEAAFVRKLAHACNTAVADLVMLSDEIQSEDAEYDM